MQWLTIRYSGWSLSHNLGNIFFLVCRPCWETGTLLLSLRSQAVLKDGSWLYLHVIGAVFRGPLSRLYEVLCNTRKNICMCFVD